MIFAVSQMHLEVDDREADQRTRFGSFTEAFFDGRDIFLRNVTALDLVKKLKARSPLAGDHADLDLTELARSARLLLMRVRQVHRLREILTIGDLRSTDIGLHLELTLHSVDEDLEVQFPHAL